VTLYIRNLVPFATIVIVFVLPISILQYLLDLGSQPEFYAMFRYFGTRARPNPTHPNEFESPADRNFIATLFFTYLLWPFALNAVAVGVAHCIAIAGSVFGRATRSCSPVAADRGLILLDFVVVLVWYVATVLLIAAIVVVAVIAWESLDCADVVVLVWLYRRNPRFYRLDSIARTIIRCAHLFHVLVVIEERGVLESLSLGFARIFNRPILACAALRSCRRGYGVRRIHDFGILAIAAAFAHLPGLQPSSKDSLAP